VCVLLYSKTKLNTALTGSFKKVSGFNCLKRQSGTPNKLNLRQSTLFHSPACFGAEGPCLVRKLIVVIIITF
jgi:hypothetical protein